MTEAKGLPIDPYEDKLASLVHSFLQTRTRYDSVRVPNERPPTLDVVDSHHLSHVTDVVQYKADWLASGRDPAVLQMLLEKVTIATPEFEDQAFSHCAGILKLIAAEGFPIALIGAGGNGQKKIFGHPAIQEVIRANSHIGNFRTEKNVLDHFKGQPDSTLVFLDNWAWSGENIDRYLVGMADNIQATTYHRPRTYAILGGVTTRAVKDYSPLVNMSAYYHIPVLCELLRFRQYAALIDQIYLPEKEEIFFSPGFADKGLTIAHDRVPDTFCIPSFLSSSEGLTGAEGKQFYLFDYHKGR